MTDDLNGEKQAVERTLAHLDRRAENLDAATLSRLRQAREAALAELADEAKRQPSSPLWWWSGGLATACGGILAVYLLMAQPGVEQPTLDQLLTDTDILAESEALEFFADLEFYAWLEGQGLEDQESVPSEA